MGSIKRERIIMIASSAFVLAALTMTGVYMNQNNKASIDDGYTVDFGAFENNVEDKLNQIALNNEALENDTEDNDETIGMEMDRIIGSVTQSGENTKQQTTMYDDLDYMPIELETQDSAPVDSNAVENAEPAGEVVVTPQAVSGSQVIVAEELHFTEGEGLYMPVSGEILMSYSMDKSVYFATLKQYRYNPAIIFSASIDAEVYACARARVISIDKDAKLGTTITLDLGDGYQATYGQLKNVRVSVGDYVEAGQVIAMVETPTKYYSLEGCNLYFEMTKNGKAINPEEYF